MDSHFLDHSNGHLMLSHPLDIFKILVVFFINKLICKFIGAHYHFEDIQIVIFIIFVDKRAFSLRFNGNDEKITLRAYRKQGYFIVLFNYGNPLFMTNKIRV
jgi:hypothetical protein